MAGVAPHAGDRQEGALGKTGPVQAAVPPLHLYFPLQFSMLTCELFSCAKLYKWSASFIHLSFMSKIA